MSSTDTRARLIAVYSLTIGVAGWALLFHLTRWETLRANL